MSSMEMASGILLMKTWAYTKDFLMQTASLLMMIYFWARISWALAEGTITKAWYLPSFFLRTRCQGLRLPWGSAFMINALISCSGSSGTSQRITGSRLSLPSINERYIHSLLNKLPFKYTQAMKYTHNAITSITVEKVENITTSMTRAGLGDDTYRRQRDKERYLKFKAEQADRQQKMREEFLNQRSEKIKAAEELTLKKSLKRNKKKQRQKQLKKKAQLLKKLQDGQQSEKQEQEQQNIEDEPQGQEAEQEVKED